MFGRFKSVLNFRREHNESPKYVAHIGVQNLGKSPIIVWVEPSAHDFTLFPYEKIEIVSQSNRAMPEFFLVESEGNTQVYIENSDEFCVRQDDKYLELGHQRQEENKFPTT
jgi:hypothetical protein